MSFLDVMEKKSKLLTKQKHPLCNEELRLREVYVVGVALLLARADENLLESEKEHLQELIVDLSLSDDPYDRVISIVTNADEEIFDTIVSALEKQEHKYLFILELYQAAHVDGNMQPEEQKMIDLFEKILDLKTVEKEFLKHFSEGVVKNDQVAIQKALLNAHHYCLEIPISYLKFFYTEIVAIPETTERDESKIELSSRQGVLGAKTRYSVIETKKEMEALKIMAERQVVEDRKQAEDDRLMFSDTQTGLMWPRNGNLSQKVMSFDEAKKWVRNLSFGGYRDWRLPTIEELESFVKLGGEKPSEWLKTNGFFNVQTKRYWTSTTQNGSLKVIGMISGSILNGGTGQECVWPVRSK